MEAKAEYFDGQIVCKIGERTIHWNEHSVRYLRRKLTISIDELLKQIETEVTQNYNKNHGSTKT